MIRTDLTPGAISFVYELSKLNRAVMLLSLYDAKTVRDEHGKSMYNDIAITDDEKEVLVTFYKEFHGELFPILSTILLRGANTDSFGLEVVWNVADGTKVENGETVYDDYYDNHHLFQNNMATILDGHLESAYKYYALYKWFTLFNTIPALSQKYHMLYSDELRKIRSAVRHNNNSATRPKLKQNPF